MKLSPILGALVLSALNAAAQPANAIPKNIRATSTLDNLFDINGLSKFDNLSGIPMEPGNVVGNGYLEAGWNRATLLLYDVEKMVENIPVRYEIEVDQFEIRLSSGVKVLSGKKVKSFVWVDSLTRSPHYFVNGNDFKDKENIPMTGFFEVLTEGRMPLLAKTELVVKNPTYNDKFDMGNRNTRIVKKVDYYYVQNGVAAEVPSGKKKFLLLFGDHAPSVEKFINTNTLTLSDGAHLRAIFEHYAAISATSG